MIKNVHGNLMENIIKYNQHSRSKIFLKIIYGKQAIKVWFFDKACLLNFSDRLKKK